MLDRQLRRLRDDFTGASARVDLIVHPGEEDIPLVGLLTDLARSIQAETDGAIAIRGGDGQGPPATPALTLARDGHENIHYLAMPEGLEAEPFVDLLIALAAEPDPPAKDWVARLATCKDPVELLVFVMTVCPHCAQAVRAAHALALANPLVTATIVDAAHFADLAAEYRVMSAPVTLVDRGLALTGAVPPEDLVDEILSRGRPEYEARVFASMAEAGRFEVMVDRILNGDGARQLARAWRDSTLALRLGLLVAAEDALDAAPHALDDIVEDLLPPLDADDAPLRGDTADLLGKIAHASAVPALKAHAADPHPDVAEAIEDALSRIEMRDRS
jgi:alkyl hydroperoxide reductase subunit AhpF